MPIDYSRTIIYKIVCKDITIKETYVGSTTQFTSRKGQHKYSCNNNKDFNVYNFIRANGGWDNWTMVMVEEYPCKTKLESDQRERHWLETLHATLNMYIPSRTEAEWREDNKGYMIEWSKNNKEHIAEYRKNNKEKKAKYKAEYNKNNKEEIAVLHL